VLTGFLGATEYGAFVLGCRVEERQLLMAMHDVDCVVDVEHDRLGGVAPAASSSLHE
jgi:hypothetical protein